jgi:hypothetical protein
MAPTILPQDRQDAPTTPVDQALITALAALWHPQSGYLRDDAVAHALALMEAARPPQPPAPAYPFDKEVVQDDTYPTVYRLYIQQTLVGYAPSRDEGEALLDLLAHVWVVTHPHTEVQP